MQTPLQRARILVRMHISWVYPNIATARNLPVKQVMEGLTLQLEEKLANFTGVRNPRIRITHFLGFFFRLKKNE